MKYLIALLLGISAFAQTKQRVFYLPRLAKPAPYRAPMKPLVRLADLEAKHRGSNNWRELVILDNNQVSNHRRGQGVLRLRAGAAPALAGSDRR